MTAPERVVNTPVPGVVEPIDPGIAQVPDRRVVALLVPEPDVVREDPVPSTMAAVVLVPDVIALKDGAQSAAVI
jgi:hypothetical protein